MRFLKKLASALIPSLAWAFRCVLCGILATLTLAAFKKLGWVETAAGPVCPNCAARKAQNTI